MTWYAIRTMPGAQQPKREYWTEPAERSRKGYRIVSGTNKDYSAVELALLDAGVTFYMPVEFVAVRDRNKRSVYELRRFAMLKGYMFVGDVERSDWHRLMLVPGVRGVVADAKREPFAISTMDLYRLRMFEANSRAVAQKKAENAGRADQRSVKEQKKTAIRGARKKLFPGRGVRLIWGDKVGRDATVQAWSDEDRVNILLANLDASVETITVPYEFLKAS